ncbi:MAG: nicotinate (nicotinamide) nucleotide adenylyltransferase, partial [Blastocatellia bacterium]
YGGTFDPVHCGHLTVAKRLVDLFDLDQFCFLPAFHAPHKPDTKPTSGYHRFAMLCLATKNELKIGVSTIELDLAEKRYSIDTLSQIRHDSEGDEIFFVMGADSWQEIQTWKEWEQLLRLTNHIVVSRPGYKIGFDQVSEEIRERIVDLRTDAGVLKTGAGPHIYITDAVSIDISATDIRQDIGEDDVLDRDDEVPPEVAKYIEKYELYK